MKAFFKYIRSIRFINKGFGNILRNSERLINKLISRWPVVGIVDIKFSGIQFKMFSLGDDNIVHILYYDKHYHESKDLKFFLELAKKSSVIYDVGANTGIYSCLSSKVNPSAKIFAFEPYPVNVVRLKKNIQLNNLENIIVVENALGNTDKLISFAVPMNNKIADTSSANTEFSKHTYNGGIKWKTIEVQQLSLDQFFENNNIDVDLIKIDVEGYEKEVFEGGKNFFKNQKALIQCEIILDTQRKFFFERFLKETGYYAYMILNDGLLRTDQTLLNNPGSLNYLFAKNKTQNAFIPYEDIQTLLLELK